MSETASVNSIDALDECHGFVHLDVHIDGYGTPSFRFATDECTHWDNDSQEQPLVWSWENPDEPVDNATLSPSIGWDPTSHDGSGWLIHGHVRDGEWV